jgi:hypothetical protein
MFYILDEENHTVEVDVHTWAMWRDTASNCIVDYTEVTSRCIVSTVFLGLDHNFSGKGPPILFETLVFGGPMDGDGQRYSSWDDAVIGHKRFVAKVRKAVGQKERT